MRNIVDTPRNLMPAEDVAEIDAALAELFEAAKALDFPVGIVSAWSRITVLAEPYRRNVARYNLVPTS